MRSDGVRCNTYTMKNKIVTWESLDDFDGTPNAETVTFAFEGVTYEIELGSKNLKKMRQAMKPYIERGRRTGGRKTTTAKKTTTRRRTSGSKKKSNGHDAAAIRAWAAENGIEVGATGMIPKAVVEQYEAAK